MFYIRDRNFPAVRRALMKSMARALPVRTERWQGKDVSKDPAATSYEIRNTVFEVDLGSMDVDYWRAQISPNLPWADDHFLERVGGQPLNPGKEWANWPWASSADKFRAASDDRDAQFNHSYMERLWPKYARTTKGGVIDGGDIHPADDTHPFGRYIPVDHRSMPIRPLQGIAWQYGDLWDLVEMLAKEPFTRQAWIPLFFPEDTGVADGGRKPCTLGYQIMVRTDAHTGKTEAHIWYPLRSCDLIRHWADDCYLAVRLLIWIIERCRELNPDQWSGIVPGTYSMHMTSLHVFENDKRELGKSV